MNITKLLAALTSAAIITSAFTGCAGSSGSSSKDKSSSVSAEIDYSSPEKVAEGYIKAINTNDFETIYEMTVPSDRAADMAAKLLNDDSDDAVENFHNTFIDKFSEQKDVLTDCELLAIEELGKLDKINSMLGNRYGVDANEDFNAEETLDMKPSVFAVADEGKPVYVALFKFTFNDPNGTGEPDEDIDTLYVYSHNGKWYVDFS